MSMFAKAYQKMVAAGMSEDDIAEMLAILEDGFARPVATVDAATEHRRAWDRDRKRRKKAESVPPVSTRIPPDPVEKVETSGPSPKDSSVPPSSNTELTQNPIPPPLKPPALSSDCLNEAVTAYNAIAAEVGLPKAKALTPDRRKHLKARLAEHGLDGWREAMEGLRAPFCLGSNDRGWKANLDFCLQPKSLSKLREDAYAGESTGPPVTGGMVAAASDELAFRMAIERAEELERPGGKSFGDQGVVVALPAPSAQPARPASLAGGLRR